MAEPSTPGASASAGAPPSPTAASPGQPSFGSSPQVTMPAANRGAQASALIHIQWAVRLLEQSLPTIGVGSELGKDVMDVLKKLSKHVPAQGASSGLMGNGMRQFLLQQRQQAPQTDVLRALAARMNSGGAGGGAGAEAPPEAGGAGGAPPPTPAAAA